MGTIAEEAYRNLEPRAHQPHSDYLRERLAEIGALAEDDTAHPRYPVMFDSPLWEGLTNVTDEVKSALIDLGYDRVQVALLTVGPTADDESLARYERRLRFIVSHEAAHHVLGHGETLDPPFEQRELDADTLALFTAAEAFGTRLRKSAGCRSGGDRRQPSSTVCSAHSSPC